MDKKIFAVDILLFVSSLIFLGVAVYMLYIDKGLQALLSLIIGIILLSSGLAVLREIIEKTT